MKKLIKLILIISVCFFGTACATSLVVDSVGDQPDTDLTDGVCKTANNNCTLRAAIMEANVLDDVSKITFKNVTLISPTTALPDMTASNTFIDGEGLVTLNGSQITEESISGLRIYDSSYNKIQGLTIKNFHFGISVMSQHSIAKYNVIGLMDSDPGDGSERNIIINNSVGISISGPSSFNNTIAGNHIGIKLNGATKGPNMYGVTISNGAHDNLIGTLSGEGIFQGWNLISGNSSAGIRISEGFQNHISGNLIGTNINGTIVKANNVGINLIYGSTNNIIGLNSAGEGVLNLISGNSFRGIEISDQESNSSIIAGNLIGTNLNGTAALGNGGSGILVEGDDTRIGTNGDGSFDQLEINVISGNGTVGINLSSNGNQVSGNLIGVDITGSVELGNNMGGVSIHGFDNLIGTNGDGLADEDEKNIISANSSNQSSGSGISISGNSNTVAGNYIGTDAAGIDGLGNYQEGISLVNGASGNLIGTDGDGQSDFIEGNLISGNGRAGIGLFSASSNTIAGNLIGTDFTGTAAIPNGHNNGSGLAAVHLAANSSQNIIGTNGDGQNDNSEGNIISGNSHVGIYLTGPNTNNNIVAGNHIGVDISGSSVLGNLRGISFGVGADFNLVGTNEDGTSDLAEANIIGGNFNTGISIAGSNNQFSGNFIGTDKFGTADLGNGGPGIDIVEPSSEIVVGGSNETANTIAFNKGSGISILGTNANKIRILNNSIHSNDRLGIDLASDSGFYDVQINDPGDIDQGPNDLMNFPVLTKATSITGYVAIKGEMISSLPYTSYLVQFFDNDICDSPSNHGEGKRYLGSSQVFTDVNGNALFSSSFSGFVPAGQNITSTATAYGKTSEFSACVEVTVGEDTYSGEIEENPCDRFNQDEMGLVSFDLRPESGLFSLYVNNPEPFPTDGPAGGWVYTAVLGETPAKLCGIREYDDRIYCDFKIPESYFNSQRILKIFGNYCFPPIYVMEDVSITTKALACTKDLGPNQCKAAGGEYKCLAACTCNCP